jgi:hypothetical protein
LDPLKLGGNLGPSKVGREPWTLQSWEGTLDRAKLRGNLGHINVLSQIKKVPISQLTLSNLMGSNMQAIENQYRKISHIDWAELTLFKNSSIPKIAREFWSAI